MEIGKLKSENGEEKSPPWQETKAQGWGTRIRRTLIEAYTIFLGNGVCLQDGQNKHRD